MTHEDVKDTIGYSLSADEVAQYLLENPDFFTYNEALLAELTLPHASGKAVSLLERQVSVLRKRNMDMRHRLTQLLETARNNDRLFSKTQKLVLKLLEASHLDDIVAAIDDSFYNEFHVETNCLTLFAQPDQLAVGSARVIPLYDAKQSIPGVIKSTRAVCGVLRDSEVQFLFPRSYQQVGSAAVVPLYNNGPLGVLAIGNEDPQHYRSSMGTVFFGYVGDVLNRVLPRFMSGGA